MKNHSYLWKGHQWKYVSIENTLSTGLWDASQQEDTHLLTSDAVVHFYDRSLPLKLLTDASRLHGLGYALIQKDKALVRLSWGLWGAGLYMPLLALGTRHWRLPISCSCWALLSLLISLWSLCLTTLFITLWGTQQRAPKQCSGGRSQPPWWSRQSCPGKPSPHWSSSTMGWRSTARSTSTASSSQASFPGPRTLSGMSCSPSCRMAHPVTRQSWRKGGSKTMFLDLWTKKVGLHQALTSILWTSTCG